MIPTDDAFATRNRRHTLEDAVQLIPNADDLNQRPQPLYIEYTVPE